MTTNSEKATTQDGAYEALIRELMGSGWNPKAAAQSEQDATQALAATAMKELGEGIAQASPYEKAVLVAVLAPALAEALAPILAQALAPALVKALSEMAAPQKTDQQSASGEGSSQQG
ncbi:MAG TPA: hypothetical protein VKV40_11710 [Ktedonobacteraceae bacterium]|nr:hypothetical protein [Ktedonobacteraceae bacterium]